VSRARIQYGDRHAFAASAGIDVSVPVAGFYRYRLGSGTIAGGVRIWYGPPLDPVTGEELDRSWRWQADFNGEPIDFDRCWPACTGDPITEVEYRRYCSRQNWARQHAPDSAYAEPGRRHDPLSAQAPLPF
jgi:hypothetical protein